jgi:electron transfer flavoprotein beta subunit
VLVFGQNSLDELDGQTGLKVAELFNAPCVTRCKQTDWKGDHLVASSETSAGIESHEVRFSAGQPAVICVMKCDYELRGSNIKGVMKANKADIPVKTIAELALTQDAAVDSALTKVLKTAPRPAKTAAKIIDGSNPQLAVKSLIEELKIAQMI